MTTSTRAVLESEETNSAVLAGDLCLSLELERSEVSLAQLMNLVVEIAGRFFGTSLLLVGVIGSAFRVPSEMQRRRGVWGLLEPRLPPASIGAKGPSIWLPPQSMTTDSGEFGGLAVVGDAGLSEISRRMAGGDSLGLVIGPVNIVENAELAELLARAVGSRSVSMWRRFDSVCRAEGLLPVRCFGAFDDRESAVQIFGARETIVGLRAWLVQEGLVLESD